MCMRGEIGEIKLKKEQEQTRMFSQFCQLVLVKVSFTKAIL